MVSSVQTWPGVKVIVYGQYYTTLASFPVPHPAFRRLQYGKAGRAGYISSREHDVIEKCQNEVATFCVLFTHLHVQRLVSMTFAPR